VELLTLSGLHDEGDTLPSLVVDVQDHGSKGRALGTLGNRLVVEVAGLVTGSGVLTEEDLLLLDGWDSSENLDLEISVAWSSKLTFSSRMSSEEKETGRSMAKTERVCIKSGYQPRTMIEVSYSRFWQTSRMIPNSSKYPPRPSVPNGSLKVIWTFETKFLFKAASKNTFPNLRTSMFLIISFPR
jgi:hypothetical protein